MRNPARGDPMHTTGIQSLVRVAIPIPGQRMFECYLMSAESPEKKQAAHALAWSALSIWTSLKEQIFQALCPLTDKELQALALTFQGLSASQVAIAMITNERLVNYYLSRAMKKLKVDSKMAAVRKMVWMGLI